MEKVRACIHLSGTAFAHSITFAIYLFIFCLLHILDLLLHASQVNKSSGHVGQLSIDGTVTTYTVPASEIKSYGCCVVFVYP